MPRKNKKYRGIMGFLLSKFTNGCLQGKYACKKCFLICFNRKAKYVEK